MNRLFNCKNVSWNGHEYIEVELEEKEKEKEELVIDDFEEEDLEEEN
jgi:hypothetical protein